MGKTVSPQDIRSLIFYDPESGAFSWKVSRRKRVMPGDAAGCTHQGYLSITIAGCALKGAEVAWMYVTGETPPAWAVLAHKDGNRLNCAWLNIEIVRRSPSWGWDDMIEYNPDSGAFTWRHRYGPAGKPLQGAPGWPTKQGYIRIASGGKEIQAHRLAHRFMTGRDVPDGMDIDHINGDRSDNRWCNLRVVSRTQNLMNSTFRPDNKSGVKGVYWDPRRQLWQAEIKVAGKREHLGRFNTIEEAAAVRRAAEQRLFGEHSFHESRKIK